MAKKRNRNLTQLDIVRTAARLFLEGGYSATSPAMVCQALDISLGSLTYYFPTKEDLLSVLIELLAEFQWKTVQELVDEGETPLTALCFELTAMASMCAESAVARDLYISAYTGPKPLTIIRKNDTARAKELFAEFCSDWTDEIFSEAETLVSGIEYATLHTTPGSPPLEARIIGAMKTILTIYQVPKERQNRKIQKALALDYRRFGQRVLEDFKAYVTDITEKSLVEAALHGDCALQRRMAEIQATFSSD